MEGRWIRLDNNLHTVKGPAAGHYPLTMQARDAECRLGTGVVPCLHLTLMSKQLRILQSHSIPLDLTVEGQCLNVQSKG